MAYDHASMTATIRPGDLFRLQGHVVEGPCGRVTVEGELFGLGDYLDPDWAVSVPTERVFLAISVERFGAMVSHVTTFGLDIGFRFSLMDRCERV